VVAVIVGAGAFLVASRHHPAWSANAVASHTPVRSHPGPKGLKRLQLLHMPAALAISTDYGRPPAAITLSPVSGSTVRIEAHGASRTAVESVVSAYTSRLKQRWQAQFTSTRSKALASIRARSGSRHVTPTEIAQAIAQVNGISPTISVSAVTAVQTSNPVAPVTSALLGAACGLLLGVVLVLAVYAIRGQIWAAEELVPVGAAVVAIDSRRPDDLHRLRIELEALGLAGGRRSVLISSAGRKSGWSPIAKALAESFADVPYEVVLVDAVGSSDGPPAPGVSQFLADPTRPLDVQQVTRQIRYVGPGGRPAADRTITAEGVAALLAEAQRHARVVIVDGPDLDSPLSALLAAAVDICVVTVHRGSSTSGAVAAAVARVRRTATADPLLCFDRVRGTVRRSAAAPAGRPRPAAAEPAGVAADAGE
jgi:hypothetical protein